MTLNKAITAINEASIGWVHENYYLAGGELSESIEKEKRKFYDKNIFSDNNVEWSSKRLSKIISADV